MIVAAAHKMPDGRVLALPAPTRHGNVFTWANNAGYLEHRGYTRGDCIHAEEGFIDSDEGFVDRDRALEIVEECGQPVSRHWKCFPKNLLFSEDLW